METTKETTKVPLRRLVAQLRFRCPRDDGAQGGKIIQGLPFSTEKKQIFHTAHHSASLAVFVKDGVIVYLQATPQR